MHHEFSPGLERVEEIEQRLIVVFLALKEAERKKEIDHRVEFIRVADESHVFLGEAEIGRPLRVFYGLFEHFAVDIAADDAKSAPGQADRMPPVTTGAIEDAIAGGQAYQVDDSRKLAGGPLFQSERSRQIPLDGIISLHIRLSEKPGAVFPKLLSA